ncbi:MAG: FAD-dependent oxidoreductase [Myxococcota bacterium]|nr:FAD-dependent oxidoreductase [Myxococcota bacterium]
MDRRKFLKIGAASSVAAAAYTPTAATARPKPPEVIRPLNPGGSDVLPPDVTRHVLIIGGGLAGLSAALELVERGYKVTLKEASDVLGGRLATRRLETGAGPFNVEHGLHMWFHNYHNFKDIRRRLHLDESFVPYNEVHFVFRDYEPEVMKSEPPVYPLNLIQLLRRSPNLSLFSAFRQLGMLKDVVGYNHDDIFERLDGETFESWAKTRVSKAFYELIMEPAASVTLNKPELVSAAEMLQMMHLYFMSDPRAMNREVTTVDHGTAVIDPWVRYLREMGASIETETPVKGLVFENGCPVGEVDDDTVYDWVVLATAVPGARNILNESIATDSHSENVLNGLRDRVGQLKVAPPYRVVRFWLDRQPSDEVPDIIESPQHPPINLAVQFHLLEEESAQWAARTNGSVIELHLYANPEIARIPESELWRVLSPTVDELLPGLGDARVIGQTVGTYEDFTSYETYQATIRPRSSFIFEVGGDCLSFAGDWVKTNYPSALMEKAVSTGREAANLCLFRDDVREVPLVVTSSNGPGLI